VKNAAGRKRKLAPGIAFKSGKDAQTFLLTREGSRPRDPSLANQRPTRCGRGYPPSAMDPKGREVPTSVGVVSLFTTLLGYVMITECLKVLIMRSRPAVHPLI